MSDILFKRKHQVNKLQHMEGSVSRPRSVDQEILAAAISSPISIMEKPLVRGAWGCPAGATAEQWPGKQSLATGPHLDEYVFAGECPNLEFHHGGRGRGLTHTSKEITKPDCP